MKVAELIAALYELPGHLNVVIEVPSELARSGAIETCDTFTVRDYLTDVAGEVVLVIE